MVKRLLPAACALACVLLLHLPASAQWRETLAAPLPDWTFLPAAACAGAGSVAVALWDVPAQPRPPRAVCVEGRNVRKGVLEFPADGAPRAEFSFALPRDFAADLGVDVTLFWTVAEGGEVTWEVATAFAAPGEVDDPAWNSPATVTTSAGAGLLQATTLARVPAAGAGPRRLLHLRVSRGAGGDSGAASLISVEVVTRRRPGARRR